ncbi:unnamed protein product [Dovyalis caffra]|uniref:Uncharacterized protein n=1 Tax=Dovyalis caffra TaxID=77055 RepID=A0AAV1RIS9_9ROSI|nr:unnamed protein product [Dovyalis caffra]
MEGAAARSWRDIANILMSPSDKGLALSWDPSASVSDEPLSYQIPKTIDTNLKRQLSGATRDAAAEKKRRIDKAYRERCKVDEKYVNQMVRSIKGAAFEAVKKEEKLNSKIKLDALTKENDRLRVENDCLRDEQFHLRQTLQHQKDEMKKLGKEFGLLKGQLRSQTTVVKVLSKRLAGSNDKELLLENAQLRHQINALAQRINNPENFEVFQLQAKIALLENEKHSLQVIVDALCEKINNDNDQVGLLELA